MEEGRRGQKDPQRQERKKGRRSVHPTTNPKEGKKERRKSIHDGPDDDGFDDAQREEDEIEREGEPEAGAELEHEGGQGDEVADDFVEVGVVGGDGDDAVLVEVVESAFSGDGAAPDGGVKGGDDGLDGPGDGDGDEFRGVGDAGQDPLVVVFRHNFLEEGREVALQRFAQHVADRGAQGHGARELDAQGSDHRHPARRDGLQRVAERFGVHFSQEESRFSFDEFRRIDLVHVRNAVPVRVDFIVFFGSSLHALKIVV
mmetsp:Transcript_23670/g.72826  ORF Transcript_23670/g.72826 Transcript_23670/m.72826 type:complete len:258 (-) Transcript_23670:486-1259(-)